MANFKACILPSSGRAVRFVPLTLEEIDAARESALVRFPSAAEAAKAAEYETRERVARSLRGISKEPVPLLMKPNPAAKDEHDLQEIPDVEATIRSVDKGAGGGWVEVTYVAMTVPGSGLTRKELFNDCPLDWGNLVMQIERATFAPKPMAALTTLTVVESPSA